MRFAGELPNYYGQQYGGSIDPAVFDTSSLPQQFDDVAGLKTRVLLRAGKIAEAQEGNLPGLSSIKQSDPLDNWATSAIEAGGRYLPHIGAFWLGINAGPTSKQDTLDSNPYYQQQQKQQKQRR